MNHQMKSAKNQLLISSGIISLLSGISIAEILHPNTISTEIVYPGSIFTIFLLIFGINKIISQKQRNLLGSISGALISTVIAYIVTLVIGLALSWFSKKMYWSEGVQSFFSSYLPIIVSVITAGMSIPQALSDSKKMNNFLDKEESEEKKAA